MLWDWQKSIDMEIVLPPDIEASTKVGECYGRCTTAPTSTSLCG
jgi:hypothetical protein